MSSWKTTIAGVFMLLGLLGIVIRDGLSALTKPEVLPAIAGGVGLILAADQKKKEQP